MWAASGKDHARMSLRGCLSPPMHPHELGESQLPTKHPDTITIAITITIPRVLLRHNVEPALAGSSHPRSSISPARDN